MRTFWNSLVVMTALLAAFNGNVVYAFDDPEEEGGGETTPGLTYAENYASIPVTLGYQYLQSLSCSEALNLADLSTMRSSIPFHVDLTGFEIPSNGWYTLRTYLNDEPYWDYTLLPGQGGQGNLPAIPIAAPNSYKFTVQVVDEFNATILGEGTKTESATTFVQHMSDLVFSGPVSENLIKSIIKSRVKAAVKAELIQSMPQVNYNDWIQAQNVVNAIGWNASLEALATSIADDLADEISDLVAAAAADGTGAIFKYGASSPLATSIATAFEGFGGGLSNSLDIMNLMFDEALTVAERIDSLMDVRIDIDWGDLGGRFQDNMENLFQDNNFNGFKNGLALPRLKGITLAVP